MPELYGSPYILPAIIVVVLLLVLLLIVMRRRRTATPARTRPAEETAEPVTEPTPREAAQAPQAAQVRAAPARAAQVERVSAESALTSAGIPMVASGPTAGAGSGPVAGLTGPRGTRVPIDDPLRSIIMDILNGWGDLATEDTNRLDIFRPEKILAVADTIELSREQKSGDYTRTRLLQIRQYAMDIKTKPRPVETEAAPTPASAPEPAGVARAVVVEATQAKAAVGPLVAAAAAAKAAVSEEAVAPEEGAEPVEATPLEESSTERGAAAAVPAVEPLDTTGEGSVMGDRAILEGRLAEEATERVTEKAPLTQAAAASFWAEEPAGWEISEPPPDEEVVAWRDEDTPPKATEPALPSWDDDITARTQTAEDSLSPLHLKIATAKQLMALPPEQRADMLIFLEPSELSQVIETSDDPGLKKTVIDVLEHVASPPSLDALRRCLDDPDPEIQLYAMNAADRLLGVD